MLEGMQYAVKIVFEGFKEFFSKLVYRYGSEHQQ